MTSYGTCTRSHLLTSDIRDLAAIGLKRGIRSVPRGLWGELWVCSRGRKTAAAVLVVVVV